MNGVGGSQPAEIEKRSGDATDLTADVTDLYVSTFQALALVLDAKYRLYAKDNDRFTEADAQLVYRLLRSAADWRGSGRASFDGSQEAAAL
jgi:hypothetical protein